MPVIPFQEWVPDAAAFGNPGSLVIQNAVPGVNSYKPFASFVAATSALDDRPRGAISVRDKDNNVYNYAGDESKLYVQSGQSWNDVSILYGYSTGTDEVWEFVQWKNRVLATNFSDDPQYIDLGGTDFADLTTDLRARHIAVVRDFVVFGNTFDSVDGNVPDRLRWSAFNDETDYTVDPATGSDYRDLKSGGWIQRIIGGEYGTVISERSTFRMSFVGAPVWFQVDEVLPGIGTNAPGSVVNFAGTIFFWSEQGVVALSNGTGVTFPGAGKVDQYLKSDLDQAHVKRVTGAADPKGGRVLWAYPGAGNTNGRPNKIIIYDVNLNKWSIVEQDVELLWRSGSVGQTMESLDNISESLDDLDVSLDSSQWVGGAPNLSAFDSSFRHGFFTGPNMTAVIDTKEMEIYSGRRTRLNAFRPLIDGGVVRAQVGYRNSQSEQVTFTPLLNQTASGRFTTRTNARYHRFRLTINGGGWTDAIGVQIEPHEAKRGEFR